MPDPFIVLAGKQYAVPPLVPRQQRIVIPALLKLMAIIKDGKLDPQAITTGLYDEILKLVFWGAIWPNDKKANEGILFDMPIPFDELMQAVNTIREQTGLFRAAPEGARPGESKAAEAASEDSTGT